MDIKIKIQYFCAVLLILSSIFIASYETFLSHDIEDGVLWYIAQAFLLAGSIFGLSFYVDKIICILHKKTEN